MVLRRHIVSLVLLAVLSGTPVLAAMCLFWCDEAPAAAAHHGGAHGDDHGTHHALEPVTKDEVAPCHSTPVAMDTVLSGTAAAVACDDALAAMAVVSPGGTRAAIAGNAPAIVREAEVLLTLPAGVQSVRHVRAALPYALSFRAPLVLRI